VSDRDANLARVEFEKVVHRTDRALLIQFDEGVQHWIPDSLIDYIDEADGVLYIPRWLADERELS